MARGRLINRSTGSDARVRAVVMDQGPWAAVLHHRLLAFLDKHGNVRADRFWLKANIFPLDDEVTPQNIAGFTAALLKTKMAYLYEVDGLPYMHFPRFRDNQPRARFDREVPEYPVHPTDLVPIHGGNGSPSHPDLFPPGAGTMPEPAGEPDGTKGKGKGKGKGRGSRKQKGSSGDEPSEAFLGAWKVWLALRRDGPQPRKLAWQAWQTRVKNKEATEDQLLNATMNYARHCKRARKIGTQTVMQAKTFYGPNERWVEYDTPHHKGTDEFSGLVET